MEKGGKESAVERHIANKASRFGCRRTQVTQSATHGARARIAYRIPSHHSRRRSDVPSHTETTSRPQKVHHGGGVAAKESRETEPTIGGSWDGRDTGLIYARPRTLHNHFELATRVPRPRWTVKIRRKKKKKRVVRERARRKTGNSSRGKSSRRKSSRDFSVVTVRSDPDR